VVSLAAALAIPVTLDNGEHFPYRDLILFVTFVAILLTLLLQGLTLPYFIRRSKVFEGIMEEPEEDEKHKLRQGLQAHTLKFLRHKHQNEWRDHAGMEKFLSHFEEKAKASTNEEWMTNQSKDIFLSLLESQRKYLVELNKEKDAPVSEEIIRWQLYLIDLEEERVKSL